MNKYLSAEGNKLDFSDGREFDLNGPRNEGPAFYEGSSNLIFGFNNESLIQE
jgi:hypothetical protein